MKENKLIAEFMGAKFNDEGFAKITKITHNGAEVLKLKEDDFEYDFSWDWLMPVVEKIEDIERIGVHIEGTYVSIKTDESGKDVEIVKGKTSFSKLESTYNAIVQFIKFYNDQNK